MKIKGIVDLAFMGLPVKGSIDELPHIAIVIEENISLGQYLTFWPSLSLGDHVLTLHSSAAGRSERGRASIIEGKMGLINGHRHFKSLF